MAKMFLMCGHPGSGKSFFAKRMAKFNGFRYLSIDDMYATFNGDPNSHDNKFDVWITFFRQIHAAEIAGQDVVIDTNAPTYCDRSEFLDWFSGFDEHYLIWIDADEELCLENNWHRGRIIPEDQMNNLFNIFEAPDLYEKSARCGGNTIRRSKWDGILRITNKENVFQEMSVVLGEVPKDVTM